MMKNVQKELKKKGQHLEKFLVMTGRVLIIRSLNDGIYWACLLAHAAENAAELVDLKLRRISSILEVLTKLIDHVNVVAHQYR